jgi:hypothetical protein
MILPTLFVRNSLISRADTTLPFFAKMGSGTVNLNLLSGECRSGDRVIEPLRTCREHLEWLKGQLDKHGIPLAALEQVTMNIDFVVSDIVLHRPYGHDFRHADFLLKCSSKIVTSDGKYDGHSERQKRWGYGHYWQELYGD